MDHTDLPAPDEGTPRDADRRREEDRAAMPTDAAPDPDPPHTTTGKITSPKFGAAGSGGLEFEPLPERD